MRNFIYISPNFPSNHWNFCRQLKNNGLNVLGIGDADYDSLTWELKDSLNEYYKVSSLENYEEVFRAVSFFTCSSVTAICDSTSTVLPVPRQVGIYAISFLPSMSYFPVISFLKVLLWSASLRG